MIMRVGFAGIDANNFRDASPSIGEAPRFFLRNPRPRRAATSPGLDMIALPTRRTHHPTCPVEQAGPPPDTGTRQQLEDQPDGLAVDDFRLQILGPGR